MESRELPLASLYIAKIKNILLIKNRNRIKIVINLFCNFAVEVFF